MTVTRRDMTLINGLGNFRVLTLSQIRKYYFGDLARSLVQRRLGVLRDKNLLRSYPFGEQGALAWTLTSEAARQELILEARYPEYWIFICRSRATLTL